MTTNTEASRLEYVAIPGHFAKLVRGGKTIARIHAYNDGTWAAQRIGTDDRRVFPSYEPAAAWLLTVIEAEVIGEVCS